MWAQTVMMRMVAWRLPREQAMPDIQVRPTAAYVELQDIDYMRGAIES